MVPILTLIFHIPIQMAIGCVILALFPAATIRRYTIFAAVRSILFDPHTVEMPDLRSGRVRAGRHRACRRDNIGRFRLLCRWSGVKMDIGAISTVCFSALPLSS